jgi:hypothetical protein
MCGASLTTAVALTLEMRKACCSQSRNGQRRASPERGTVAAATGERFDNENGNDNRSALGASLTTAGGDV